MIISMATYEVGNMDAYETAESRVKQMIVDACESIGYKVDSVKLELPKEEFGDFASPIAFDLAKEVKKAPRIIAGEIKANIKLNELFAKVEVAGAGYLNFYLDYAKFSELVLNSIDADYGKNDLGKGRTVIVEFPSVNPNKPWHIGHLRNALLGDSVARILEFSGFNVQRIDYIDDLGLQVAQSIWGYLHLSNRIEGKVDHWLGEQYVEVAKRIEEPNVAEEVRNIVKELEEGKSTIAALGRELALKCVLAQYETAFKFNIFHDVLIWESDIVREKLFEAAIKKAMECGAAVKETAGKNAGCIVARLDELPEFKGMESADKVLVRSDGTAVYTGKDLAFQLWKFGLIPSNFKFHRVMEQPNGKLLYSTGPEGVGMPFGKADVVVNVIGVEQAYPQLVLKILLKLMGYEKQSENSIHLAYEHAALPEGRFSGRRGTWLGFTADELVEETTKEALKQVRERFKDMGEEEKQKIAKTVAVGAIRFDFLRATPERKIIFKWEEALRFEGDTAPYTQYSYARATRILEKAGEVTDAVDYSVLSSAEEKRLIKKIALFPKVVLSAATAYRPHMIADYLLELASDFSKFYTNRPVLQANPVEKAARLKLVSSYRQVLKNGLWLLGIDAPERM